MSFVSRVVPILVLALLCALQAGCAGKTPDPAPTGNVPVAQGDAPEEKPEPLPPGVKPLTVEQEEMIAQ
ncbi:hypothetical protein ACSBOB_30095 [Mesorhizobium sp. ASY16-5R]|uniref:hypothetical protein n=1 Tax=Mesorhizobium sp. ASY16-5R TaxID=3445772 RepID=UPI003FA106B2